MLLSLSLCPFFFGMAGTAYLLGAFLFGACFVWFSVRFARHLTAARARQLFLASIVYLPLLFGLLVLDKIK
jgi:protoheme IX farnesyltransferase